MDSVLKQLSHKQTYSSQTFTPVPESLLLWILDGFQGCKSLFVQDNLGRDSVSPETDVVYSLSNFHI